MVQIRNIYGCLGIHVTYASYALAFRWHALTSMGIIIDPKLKFYARTVSVTNKAKGALGPIYKIFECKDADVILNL